MSKFQEPKAGDKLGRYRLERELGRGSMGLVFVGEDTLLSEKLCIKVLHPNLGMHAEAIERFRRELLLARRIAHRGVCRLHDIHVEDGIRFITMEYIEGTTLREMLRAETPMPVDEALRIGRSLCDALAAAHDVGVVHRDLKPRNIMIRPNGDAVILDFGIATALDMGSQLTMPGVALGTTSYIAPEVWAGKSATQKSDQFAVGVILFNCLTNAMPFAESTTALILETLQKGAPKPSAQRPEVPASIDNAVGRALSFRPESRFDDVRQLMRALERINVGMKGGDDDTTVVGLGAGMDADTRRSAATESASSEASAVADDPSATVRIELEADRSPRVSNPGAPRMADPYSEQSKPPTTAVTSAQAAQAARAAAAKPKPKPTGSSRPGSLAVDDDDEATLALSDVPLPDPAATAVDAPPQAPPPKREPARPPAPAAPAAAAAAPAAATAKAQEAPKPPAGVGDGIEWEEPAKAPPRAKESGNGAGNGAKAAAAAAKQSGMDQHSMSASWVVAGQKVDLPATPKVMEVKAGPAPQIKDPHHKKPQRLTNGPVLVIGGLVIVMLVLVLGALLSNKLGLNDDTPPVGSDVPVPPSTATGATGATGVTTAPDEPDAPKAPLTPEQEAQSAAYSQALATFSREMIAKGVRTGDVPEIDKARATATGHAKQRELEAAQAALADAKAALASTTIDKAFVERKLARFEGGLDGVADPDARGTLEQLVQRARGELGSGKVAQANRTLEDAFGKLAKAQR